MAQTIRERIKEDCGECITCSIGIAQNKLVAKLASESCKPNGLTVVRPEQVLDFVASQELNDFCGLGRQTEKHLNELGIFSVTDIRTYSLKFLLKEFKSYGLWLYQACRGQGDDFVNNIESLPKSVGHSYTMPYDLDNPKEIKRQLLALADKVAWRLRRDGFVARAVSAFVRFKDLSGFGREHRFCEPTSDGAKLAEIGWSLIKNEINRPVRLVGISASQLTVGTESKSLFKKEQKLLYTTSALDRIQTRYGSDSWTRASLLRVEFQPRSSGWAYDHEL